MHVLLLNNALFATYIIVEKYERKHFPDSLLGTPYYREHLSHPYIITCNQDSQAMTKTKNISSEYMISWESLISKLFICYEGNQKPPPHTHTHKHTATSLSHLKVKTGSLPFSLLLVFSSKVSFLLCANPSHHIQDSLKNITQDLSSLKSRLNDL